MEITWLGDSCFRLRSREGTVVTDPCDKSTGYNIGRPTADIVTVSHDDPAQSNVGAVAGSPRVVRGPGEYEISGVLIVGVRTYRDGATSDARSPNTCYVFEMENLRVCHLGELGQVPTAEQAEELSRVDILLLPVGGGDAMSASGAVETVSLLEPKLVIPMHYKTDVAKGDLEPLDRFLKEIGAPGAADERQPKLSVTKSTLGQETKVQVLEYKG